MPLNKERSCLARTDIIHMTVVPLHFFCLAILFLNASLFMISLVCSRTFRPWPTKLLSKHVFLINSLVYRISENKCGYIVTLCFPKLVSNKSVFINSLVYRIRENKCGYVVILCSPNSVSNASVFYLLILYCTGYEKINVGM